MAKPKTASASKLLILLGDGASPETFAAPCGLTTKGLNFTAESNDITVPDCDDPDAPAWVERAVRNLTAGVSGSGVLAAEAFPDWWDYFMSAQARDCRIKIASDDFANATFAGRFLLTQFNITAELGNKINVAIELQSDGEVTQAAGT